MRDGRIVQIGTAEEILTDPANDYVAQFVADVDRTRVLTARSVMEKPHQVLDVERRPAGRREARCGRPRPRWSTCPDREDSSSARCTEDEVLRALRDGPDHLDGYVDEECARSPRTPRSPTCSPTARRARTRSPSSTRGTADRRDPADHAAQRAGHGDPGRSRRRTTDQVEPVRTQEVAGMSRADPRSTPALPRVPLGAWTEAARRLGHRYPRPVLRRRRRPWSRRWCDRSTTCSPAHRRWRSCWCSPGSAGGCAAGSSPWAAAVGLVPGGRNAVLGGDHEHARAGARGQHRCVADGCPAGRARRGEQAGGQRWPGRCWTSCRPCPRSST